MTKLGERKWLKSYDKKYIYITMENEFVYLVWHTHLDEDLDNGEDIKLIGVFRL